MTSPVYLQIFENIKNQINNSELKPGERILPETALCKLYETSRATVRKGLALLSNEGYIYSIPGKGCFVQTPQQNRYLVYYDEMNNLINTVDQTRLLEVNVIVPDDHLANSLQISRSKNVIVIRRLFFTDGEPIAYDLKYLPYVKGMPIVEKEIETATFPEMIPKNIPLLALKKNIVIYAQIPSGEVKEHLRIRDNRALLVVEQKLFDSDNRPVGFGITSFKSDYIKLEGVSQ
ncbi:putative HTH-type transcriptional regulator YurK [Peptococcaceae bacterium CEB3]|nr:putative HTH-type transcriptional regulator YurK [Peptococcaceae bacterium CEB3]